MAKRRWTLVLVPHGAEPSRIVEVSYGVLRVAASATAGFLVLVLLAGYATVSHTTDLSRTARLQQENENLAREIGELNGRLSTLADTLTRIAQRDAHIRVLANLEPIDPQVQAAGIGGPAGVTNLGLAGMTGIARRSAEVRIDLSALIRRANLLASSFKEAADSLAFHSARLAATVKARRRGHRDVQRMGTDDEGRERERDVAEGLASDAGRGQAERLRGDRELDRIAGPEGVPEGAQPDRRAIGQEVLVRDRRVREER